MPILCSLNMRHSNEMSKGTFLAAKARSHRSFSCSKRRISSSVSLKHFSSDFRQVFTSSMRSSILVSLSCCVQRVWLSLSFLNHRPSWRIRCDESLNLCAVVRTITLDWCQSDMAYLGGNLSAFCVVVAIFLLERKKKLGDLFRKVLPQNVWQTRGQTSKWMSHFIALLVFVSRSAPSNGTPVLGYHGNVTTQRGLPLIGACAGDACGGLRKKHGDELNKLVDRMKPRMKHVFMMNR